jgi:DNA-directed RNA polymerase delta subunit
MDYLKRATKYAEDRGDELWFSDVYTRLREYFNVADSVWKALAFLYSDEVADQVEAG